MMSQDSAGAAGEDQVIPQNHERGPGLFLKLSYLVIVAFCLYYCFANWAWKSDYDLQQEKIATEAVN